MNLAFSSVPKPTLFTLPSLAKVSATASKTLRSASVISSNVTSLSLSPDTFSAGEVSSVSKKLLSKPFLPVLLRPPEELRKFFEGGVSYDVDAEEGGGDDTVNGAPMRTRMQCVGRLFRRQINLIASSQPGIGVTTSAGVYRKDTGKILVSLAADKRDGESLRIPRPLLVVVSGKTTMTRP